MSSFPFLLQAAVSYLSVSYWRGLAVFSRKPMKKIIVIDERIFRVYKAFDRER